MIWEQILNVLGCGVVYFAVVYVLMIRRDSQPITPWAVCISGQVLCSIFFDQLKAFFNKIFAAAHNENIGMIVASALLFFGNMILIFVMFGLFMNKKKAEQNNVAVKQEEFHVATVNLMSNQNQPGGDASGANKADITLDFIKKMIADGRVEEATKYLKMLAYYGKDEQAKAEATELLTNLTKAEDEA